MIDINTLFAKHYNTIYTYVNCIIKDKEEAKDATQLAFLKIYDKMDIYDSSKPFLNWAITVAKNFAIDYKRKMNRENNIINDIHNNLGTSLAISISSYNDDNKEYKNLYGKYRILYMLYNDYQLTSQQISDITGLSIGTILCNISKCRKGMKLHDG